MNVQFHFILIQLLIPFQDTSSGLNSIVSSGLNGARICRRGPKADSVPWLYYSASHLSWDHGFTASSLRAWWYSKEKCVVVV